MITNRLSYFNANSNSVTSIESNNFGFCGRVTKWWWWNQQKNFLGSFSTPCGVPSVVSFYCQQLWQHLPSSSLCLLLLFWVLHTYFLNYCARSLFLSISVQALSKFIFKLKYSWCIFTLNLLYWREQKVISVILIQYSNLKLGFSSIESRTSNRSPQVFFY